MKNLIAYLQQTFCDPLYFKVATAIAGLLAIALGGWIGVSIWRPHGALEWFGLALPAAMIAGGIYLFYAATMGSQKTFDKAAVWADTQPDLIEWVFPLALAILALPVTMMLKWIKRSASAK